LVPIFFAYEDCTGPSTKVNCRRSKSKPTSV